MGARQSFYVESLGARRRPLLGALQHERAGLSMLS
jgi:hypothetical protein